MANKILDDLRRIRREVTALQNMKIIVGIQGDEGSEVLIIAHVHEFGCLIKMTDKMRRYLGAIGMFDDDIPYIPHPGSKKGYVNIPERRFIRASYDESGPGREGVFRMAFSRILSGEWTARQAAENIGLYCVQITQGYIDDDKVRPYNSLFTQMNKSQNTTLYSTGTHIRDRITFKIEEGGNG